MFSVLSIHTFSQQATGRSQKKIGFWKLSGPEKYWVITHPFIANMARKITVEARQYSDQMKANTKLDGDADGGRVDALRHSYWMARMAQSFCWKKAIKLGIAHEKGNYKFFKKGQNDEESVLPDSISSVMDLYNNEIGAKIGCSNNDISPDSIKTVIFQSIIIGKMLIISKNGQGVPIDCNGKVIDTRIFESKWYIPKCLAPSGF